MTFDSNWVKPDCLIWGRQISGKIDASELITYSLSSLAHNFGDFSNCETWKSVKKSAQRMIARESVFSFDHGTF